MALVERGIRSGTYAPHPETLLLGERAGGNRESACGVLTERGHVRKRADQAAPRIPVPERERQANRVAHGRWKELRVPGADALHHSRILS